MPPKITRFRHAANPIGRATYKLGSSTYALPANYGIEFGRGILAKYGKMDEWAIYCADFL